jgi:hypothetical protein
MSKSLLEKPVDTADYKHKVSVITEDFQLSAADRCDRCSSQAYYDVTLTNSGRLLFCAHHYKAQERNLLPLPTISKVRDESEKLHFKPPVADD